MLSNNKDIFLLIILCGLAIFVFSSTLYGIVAKPIIEYGLNSDLKTGDRVTSDEIIRVNITVKNIGYLSSNGMLVTRCYNLTYDNKESYEKNNFQNYTEFKIPLKLDTTINNDKQISLSFSSINNSKNLLIYIYLVNNFENDIVQNYCTSFNYFVLKGNNLLFLSKNGDIFVKQSQDDFNVFLKLHPKLLQRK